MKRFVNHLSLIAAGAMVATGCVPTRHNLPPTQHLMHPGPGVDGPGPGVLGPQAAMGAPMGAPMGMPAGMPVASTGDLPGGSGVVPASFADPYCPPGSQGYAQGSVMEGAMVAAPQMQSVQVTFGRPEGMQIRYDQTGSGTFDSDPLICPARQNFPQGGLYRLKLTNIPNREGVELYPTVELAFANPRTGAYLAHNSIPIQFDQEDFDQVVTGNFVTKVLYLPDPDFQGPALAGIDTLVSTRLDPGIDPIVEADRRGSILAIIRLGDKDIEMAGSGALGAMSPPINGLPAPFAVASSQGCGPIGAPGAAGPSMIAGVNMPQYGMTMTGTPIGLPGPPHLPLGGPAGLTKHVMTNHTKVHMPAPVDKFKINVRQSPGYRYPNPVSRVNISQRNPAGCLHGANCQTCQ
ncbi:hypothetical protein SV7mr_44470 [Stieleria bergensis]|uniref:Uncharacterized protein n=1 Tax=Stieleria bergensis TaxID=2528025 RepID=A0A517T0I0_9BACT|nr:hypothetical protein SV7mr_44470 [Planctomycetes bacterium SV_7m_r]